MKQLNKNQIEMYMDYIELHQPMFHISIDENRVMTINRNYVNKMIVLTETTFDECASFLECYFDIAFEDTIKDYIITF